MAVEIQSTFDPNNLEAVILQAGARAKKRVIDHVGDEAEKVA